MLRTTVHQFCTHDNPLLSGRTPRSKWLPSIGKPGLALERSQRNGKAVRLPSGVQSCSSSALGQIRRSTPGCGAAVIALALCSFILPPQLTSQPNTLQPKPMRRVLILNEVGPAYPLIKLVDEGIQAGLANSP